MKTISEKNSAKIKLHEQERLTGVYQ